MGMGRVPVAFPCFRHPGFRRDDDLELYPTTRTGSPTRISPGRAGAEYSP